MPSSNIAVRSRVAVEDRLAGHQRDRTADARLPAQSRVGRQETAIEKLRQRDVRRVIS